MAADRLVGVCVLLVAVSACGEQAAPAPPPGFGDGDGDAAGDVAGDGGAEPEDGTTGDAADAPGDEPDGGPDGGDPEPAADGDGGTQPDGDLPDGGPGPDPEPDPVVDPAVAAYCAGLCDAYDTTCDPSGASLDEEACLAGCTADGSADLQGLSSWSCLQDACDADICQVGGAPLPDDPACPGLCASLDACNLLAAVGFPEDEPEICVAACAGKMVGLPFLKDLLPCMEDALDPTCDPAAFGACFGGLGEDLSGLCADACAGFYDADKDEYCAPGTPFRDVLSDVLDCEAQCASYGAVSPALKAHGCMLTSGCEDPTPCFSPPSKDDPACGEACEAIFALCGTFGALPSPAECTPFCTGLVQNLGGAADPAAAACLAAAGTCPESENAQGQLFGQCISPSPEACDDLCGPVGTCLGEGGTESCLGSCAFGQFGDEASIEEIADCALVAEPDCVEVFKCLPAADPYPVCNLACGKDVSECNSDPALEETCVDGCEEALDPGDGVLADWMCRLFAPCDDNAFCTGLSGFAVPQQCKDACAASPSTCSGYPDGCEAACTGALSGGSFALVAADCVVGALGPTCDTATVSSCKGP